MRRWRNFFYALAQNLVKIPFIVTGLVMVPILWQYRHLPQHSIPKDLWPWLNPEDWTYGYRNFPPEYNCIPPDLQDRYKGFWGFFRYHAIRNGGDGLRNYSWHLCNYHEGPMTVYPSQHGYYIEMGKYGSWLWHRWGITVKFGWRMNTVDAWVAPDKRAPSIRWKYGAAPTWSVRYET